MSTLLKFRRDVFAAAAALGVLAVASTLGSQPARADDCLLDSNNNGVADASVDTDGGANAQGSDNRVACGHGAVALAERSIAIGIYSQSTAEGAITIGGGNTSNGTIGAQASGVDSIAIGTLSQSVATDGIAIGSASNATAAGAIAFGGDSDDADEFGAQATGIGSVALGTDALAGSASAVAVGMSSQATAASATALGQTANASAVNSTALGSQSSATAANSVAIGFGSVANQANTVSVGTVGGERRIVNLAAGTATTDAVNVGQLAVTNASLTAIQAVNTTQTTQINTLTTGLATTNSALGSETNARLAGDALLGERLDNLSFDVRRNGREAQAGTSAALAAAALPQAMDPGRSMIAASVGTYRGRVALAVGGSHRISGGNAVMKVGVTYDTTEHVGANAGVGIQF